MGFVRLHGTFHIKSLYKIFKQKVNRRIKQQEIEETLDLHKYHIKHQNCIKDNTLGRIKTKVYHYHQYHNHKEFKQLSLFKALIKKESLLN